jgi:titin
MQVTVNWTDRANNEDGFVVERAPVINGVVGAYQQVPGVGTFLPPSAGSGLQVTFLDTAAVEAQTSVYRVKAINLVSGDSGYAMSNQVTLGLFAPASVAAVAAVPSLATNVQTTVTWLGVSQKATSYLVERKIGAAAWAVVPTAPTVAGQQWQVVDSFVTATTSRTVQYRVTARTAVLSSQSVIGSVAIPARAAVPGSLSVSTSGQPARALRVRFSVANTAVGYEIQRRVGAGAWTTLTVPPAVGTGTITYIDSGLTSGTTYNYAVRAYNAGGWSNWSGSQSARAR